MAQDIKESAGGPLARHPLTPADDVERELLQRYLARKRADLERLEQALASEDYVLLRRMGHNLAGSGAAYGIPRISRFGRQIEDASGRHAAVEAASSIAEFRRFLDTVTIEPIG